MNEVSAFEKMFYTKNEINISNNSVNSRYLSKHKYGADLLTLNSYFEHLSYVCNHRWGI